MASKDSLTGLVVPPNGTDIDKMALWGEFIQAERNAQWREKAAEKYTYKVLDMAPDPPELNIAPTTDNRQQHNNGIGWKELAAIGGIGIAGLFGINAMNKPEQPPAPVVQPAPVDKDTDTDSSVKLRWGD